MAARKVIISTPSINAYGFRVLTSGIDIEQYKKNPIVLWMHSRPMWGKRDEVLPIGTMKKIARDGDNLVGEIEFDATDDFAKKIEAKWDAGILKMVSAGLSIKESSSDVKLMIDGQTRPTVTKSKLIEVSVVDIGANDDALALYNEDSTVINLSAGMESTLPLINNKNQNKNMDEILKLFGLPQGSTESSIIQKIMELKQQNEAMSSELTKLTKSQITTLVDSAVSSGKITQDKKPHFVELGLKIGIEQLKLTLESISEPIIKPTPRKPEILASLHQKPQASTCEWTKLSDVPDDKIEALREEDFETYSKLYKAEFGITLKQ